MSNKPQKKGAWQKAAIIEQASILFSSRGFSNTTVRDIAHACGFDAGNLYNYFIGKEEILYEVLHALSERLISQLQPFARKDHGDPVDRLRSLVITHMDFIANESNKASAILFDSEIRHLKSAHRKKILGYYSNYDNIVQTILQSGVDADSFRVKDVKATGYLIYSMIIRTGLWYSPSGRLTSYQIADIIFSLIFNGILIDRAGADTPILSTEEATYPKT